MKKGQESQKRRHSVMYKIVQKLRQSSALLRESVGSMSLHGVRRDVLSAAIDSTQVPVSSLFVFSPDHFLRLFWDLLVCLFVVYQMVLLPYSLAFNIAIEGRLAMAEAATVAVFLADILVSLNTGYYRKGDLVLDRRLIAIRYAQTWLLADILSSFPFSWCLDPNSGNDALWVLIARVIRLSAVLRTARLVKVREFLRKAEEVMSSTSASRALVFSRLLLVLLLLAHWIACAWHYLASNSETATSWMIAGDQHTSGEMYVTALYWSFATMTTVGYGDIVPETTNERIFGTVVVTISCGVFAYVLGEIGSLVAKQSAAYGEYRSRLIALNGFMHEKRLPGDLQHRARRHVEYEWSRGKEAGEEEVLQGMSEPLVDEIMMQVHGHVLQRYPLFQSYPTKLIARLSRSTSHESFSPSDSIFEEGQMSTTLYFILEGKVDIYHGSTKSSFALLGKGRYFGEIGFMLGSPRCASARCHGFTTVLEVDRTCFNQCLAEFPQTFTFTNQQIAGSQLGDLSSIFVHCYVCKRLGHIARICEIATLPTADVSRRKWLRRNGLTRYISPELPIAPNYSRTPKRSIGVIPTLLTSPQSSNKLRTVTKNFEESVARQRHSSFTTAAALFPQEKETQSPLDINLVLDSSSDDDQEVMTSGRCSLRPLVKTEKCKNCAPPKLHVIEEGSAGSEA